MSPIIESMQAGQTINAFASKKVSKSEHKATQEKVNMSENTVVNEAAEQTNTSAITEVVPPVKVTPSTISIADLYAEMETELVTKGVAQHSGLTAKIRETVDAVFAATQKDKLLLAAVVKIVEGQTGQKKIYNLVRSVANAKNGKFALETINGKAYIVLRNA